jgi:hypothetical protein
MCSQPRQQDLEDPMVQLIDDRHGVDVSKVIAPASRHSIHGHHLCYWIVGSRFVVQHRPYLVSEALDALAAWHQL